MYNIPPPSEFVNLFFYASEKYINNLTSRVTFVQTHFPENCLFLKRKPFVHFVCFFKCCSFFLASCRNDSRYKNSSRVKESSRQTMLEKFSDLKLKTFVQHGFLFNKITKFYCCSVFSPQKIAQFFFTSKKNNAHPEKPFWFCSPTKLKPKSTQSVKKNPHISKRIAHPGTKKFFPVFFFWSL